MIIIKSDPEVDLMRQAGRITAGARTIARQMVEPGVTTRQINREVHKFITKSGASPCFMTDGGFPTAACISVNDEIIHGIPGDRVLHEGDIVSVDVGARYRLLKTCKMEASTLPHKKVIPLLLFSNQYCRSQ